MDTPRTRDFLRRPSASRRRSVRQALAVIPNATNSTASPGEAHAIDLNAMDNLLNSQHVSDSCSPAPSPDELVIQKRGRRRKTIVWSPDLDACKRNNLFSLSSMDRTPVKSPTRSSRLLKSTPRKRLSLDINESQFRTPEKKKKPTNSVDTSQKHFTGNLTNGLRGLSHNQLVQMVIDLVSMQEDGMISEGEKLRDIILKRMPVADIQPLIDVLNNLRQNIYGSLVSSNLDDSAYNRAYIHLDAFQKTIIDHCKRLLESQHWISVIQYVCAAWTITKKLPEWENQCLHNVTHECFKNLTQFCSQALKKGSFNPSTLDTYADRLDSMVADCEDMKICLQLLNEARSKDI